MKLKTSLMVIAAAPVAFAVCLTAANILDAFQNRSQGLVTLNAIDDATLISDLIHELQKERGMSAGHVASGGAAFKAELKAQRLDTDSRIAEVLSHHVDMVGGEATGGGDFAEVFAEVGEMRRGVDALTTKVPTLAKYYTGLVNRLMKIVRDDLNLVEDGEIAHAAVPFLTIMETKEKAGLERAMGAAGFGKGAFPPPIYLRFSKLIGGQQSLLTTVDLSADPKGAELMAALLASDALAALSRLRTVANESVFGGGLGGVTGPEWFKTSTAWVDELKLFENHLAALLSAQGAALVHRAERAILVLVAISAIVLAICALVPYFVTRSLTRDVETVLSVMGDIAENRLDGSIPDTGKDNEIGALFKMALTFQGNAKARLAAEEASAEDRAQRRAAETEARRREDQAEAERKAAEVAEAERQRAAEREERERAEQEREMQIEAERKEVELREQAAKEKSEMEGARRRDQKKQADALKNVVGDLSEALKRLAAGELSVQLASPFAAEYEQLRTDFNSACASLCETLSGVLTKNQNVKQGAEQISQSSENLAKRTEDQAASIVETAEALSSLSGSIKTATNNAAEAKDATSTARGNAEAGERVVSEAVAAIDEINQSSEKISQIIGVIDEIAFQTNLLALNAQVEAARAGDAGRGFAVVASEVHNLAKRCTQAANEIKDLISTSDGHVKQGVKLVGETGQALEKIIRSAQIASDLVAEISERSREQSSAVSEINGAVMSIERVTQQNAAMVQESNAACAELNSEVLDMAAMMTRFSVENARDEDEDWREAG
ncbi:MAG: methyl-accepting chemotaxis protein [Pseudomonadota bacterium]